MSKRKTKAEDVNNPENYFNRYIALEIQKGKVKDKKYNELFCPLEIILSGGNEKTRRKNQSVLAVNLDDDEFEKHMIEANAFGWIEMIENEALFEAISQLSEKDKIFLTLRFQYCLSQPEIAKIMGLTQQAASWREVNVIKKIKKFLKMLCENQ